MVRPRFASALRRTPAPGANRPHRGLRCPPGTYFSSRRLHSNLSDLEENAVLDHQVRPRHRAQPPPQAPPRQPRARTPRTGRATSPACRGRTIGLVGLHPQGQPSAPTAHPRGSAGQGHLTRTRASVRATTPAHVRPSAYAPGEVPAPTHQAASLPVPRDPRVSSPATSRIPASLKERRADIGQHPQAH